MRYVKVPQPLPSSLKIHCMAFKLRYSQTTLSATNPQKYGINPPLGRQRKW